MIIKDVLNFLRANRQKPYFGSEAKPMFPNGVFTSDNWNGGDDIIRHFFYHFGYGNSEHYELDFNHEDGSDESINLVINYNHFDDTNYATLIMDGYRYYHENNMEYYIDIAYFNWYKSRGKTDAAWFNGKPMTEDQYIRILNVIEKTGYKFQIS